MGELNRLSDRHLDNLREAGNMSIAEVKIKEIHEFLNVLGGLTR